jgi:hypothetical protein
MGAPAASLLLHEGRDVIYVARQLGHGAELTLATYGHMIEELEDSPQLPAEEAIRQARETMRLRQDLVRVCARFSRLAARRSPDTALVQGAPSWIRTSGLLLRRESLYPAELSGRGPKLNPQAMVSRELEAMLAAESAPGRGREHPCDLRTARYAGLGLNRPVTL